MNYVPAWIPFAKDWADTDKPTADSSTDNAIQVDTQSSDSNEHQLSVSSTDSGLFESADQISVSDVPSDQRKKNSFYRWFKRKLWCIRRSKSADSGRIKNQTFRNAKIEIKKSTSERKASQNSAQSESSAQEEPTVKNKPTRVNSAQPSTSATSAKKSADVVATPEEHRENEAATVQKTPRVAPPRERQVTFSDTVKTHIKTKYVTAEEYKQITGMDMNNRAILYQYNQQSAEPKSCILGEKSTHVRSNKSDHYKCKHTNDNVLKI